MFEPAYICLFTKLHRVYDELLVHYVHGHFEAKTHFCSSWFSPHNDLLKN